MNLPLHRQRPFPTLVSLRRYGDILNLLPLLLFFHQQTKEKVRLVVHKDFAGLLEGVSYVTPIIWEEDLDSPLAACNAHRAINAQVHGRGVTPNRAFGDFAKTAWKQLGYEWNRHVPLVFDQRDCEREQKLAESVFKTDLPKVLVKLNGFSSPFGDADKLRALLQSEFQCLAEIVDVDSVKADRLYDLIGLMDRAACLVSCDTATLWLAKATQCPVISLVNNHPFLSSPPTGNVLLRLPYSSAVKEYGRIATAIHSTLFEAPEGGMVLVYNPFKPSDPDTQRRNSAAMASWSVIDARHLPFVGDRTSLHVGDKRGTAFIRDMLDAAFSTGPENIAIIANCDIKVDPKIVPSITESCHRHGCWWTHRVEAPGKPDDGGADMFAMTRKWWYMHRHHYPDLLISYVWWDDILSRMMRWSGCLEQDHLCYHEPHPAAMSNPALLTGHNYNAVLANRWLAEHHELTVKPK